MTTVTDYPKSKVHGQTGLLKNSYRQVIINICNTLRTSTVIKLEDRHHRTGLGLQYFRNSDLKNFNVIKECLKYICCISV